MQATEGSLFRSDRAVQRRRGDRHVGSFDSSVDCATEPARLCIRCLLCMQSFNIEMYLDTPHMACEVW